jgi:hypothetical protein
MPRVKRRHQQSQQVAAQAAAKRRHAPSIVPDPEYFSDTQFSPLRSIDAETEVAAQGWDEDGDANQQAEYRDQWICDGSESMSGSEESVSGGDSELDRPDEIEGDGWSEAEASSACDSELDESNATQSVSLGLDGETSWEAAEAKLPGNSRQIAIQTRSGFT